MIMARAALEIVRLVNKTAYYLIGLLLMVMAVSTLFQVLVRFVFTAVNFNFSAPWTEEVARYCMIWVIFIGMGIASRHAQLISLEFLVGAFKGLTGQVLRYVALLICLVLFGLLIRVGLEFVEFGSIERSPVLRLEKTWVYWAMPVGATLAFINTLALCLETWVQGRDIREPTGISATLDPGRYPNGEKTT